MGCWDYYFRVGFVIKDLLRGFVYWDWDGLLLRIALGILGWGVWISSLGSGNCSNCLL